MFTLTYWITVYGDQLGQLHNGEGGYIFYAQKGKVIFMDAYPIEWPDGLFRVDIMNPHYGPYYESPGKNPPADWYNPVPVPYLTVNIGVTYRFILLSQNGNLLKKAYEWLEFALENIGVGAKGNQGYGVFEVIKITYNAHS